ncbi:MAG: oligoribonuclease [Proteobacteria bacterium]|nr:MAG: oligoribonuclease [Pseudomonadota bacterium]
MNYLWIDMEMSGLEVSQCRILEVAAIITDADFKGLESYEAIVYQEPAVLTAMDAWCTKQHGESGLTAAVASGKPEALVEQELIAFIDKHFKPNERPILCGNSIGQDRKFIDAYMPDLAKRLHYRMVDVTSFKVILQDRIGSDFKKNDSHRALGDIEESIGELKHYLSFFAAPTK